MLLEYADWLNARMAVGAPAGTRPRELKPKQLAAVFARPAFPVPAISRKAAVLVERGGPVFQEVVAAKLPVDELTTRARELLHDGKLTLIDFDIATLFGFPRTRELVDRRELDQKSYADLLTELHGEVCTANTGAAARAAAARARWNNRPVT